MTREDIIGWMQEVGAKKGHAIPKTYDGFVDIFQHFAALVAAEKEQQMLRDGWRQCAKGQRTTQHCGLLDAAVKAEREACEKVCEALGNNESIDEMEYRAFREAQEAIRSRGEVKP